MTTITVNGVTFDLDNLTGADGRGYNVDTDDGSGNIFPFYISVMSAALQDASRQLVTTSASSVEIGLGSKTFVLDVNLPLFKGVLGRSVDTADEANFVDFTITTYTSATKTAIVNVTNIGGSGTLNSWNLVFGTGPKGDTGPSGTLDINGLPAVTLPETDDEIPIFDTSAAGNAKVELDDMAIFLEIYSRMFI